MLLAVLDLGRSSARRERGRVEVDATSWMEEQRNHLNARGNLSRAGGSRGSRKPQNASYISSESAKEAAFRPTSTAGQGSSKV